MASRPGLDCYSSSKHHNGTELLTWEKFGYQDSVKLTVEDFNEFDDLIAVSESLENVHLPLGSLCVGPEVLCSVQSVESSSSLLYAEHTTEGPI